MLVVKKNFANKTVILTHEGRKVMFDGSKNYSQKQLEKLFKDDKFSRFITDIQDDNEPIEVKERAPRKEYPVMDLQELEATNLSKLKKIYPFAKSKSKVEFMEEVLQLNYGNTTEEEQNTAE